MFWQKGLVDVRKGHEWNAVIASRTKGSGCPVCSNKKVLTGYNDLATTYPELATEWHPTKNGDLKPTDIIPNSKKKVWWMTTQRGEWQASVCGRVTSRIKNSKNSC